MPSVAMLPVRSSLAIGQPPNPFSAESNRRQPAFQAASIFSTRVEGVECKCTPNSIAG
ncbi:hypothetical protein D3C85_1454220 [compost metagenome]